MPLGATQPIEKDACLWLGLEHARRGDPESFCQRGSNSDNIFLS